MTRAALVLLHTLAVALAAPAAATAAPAPQKTVVTFVVPDEPIARSSLATLELTFDKALKKDDRIRVVDEDLQLVERAGEVPNDLVAEARGLLATGEALLKKGRPSEALARLMPAEAQLELLLPHVKKRELARTQFLIGVSHAMLGDKEEARAAFVRLLIWRPDHELDTDIEPGKVIPLWEPARERARSLPTSTVRVRSSPDAALAYINGEFIGFTPTSKKRLSVGTHYVTLRAKGYARVVRKIVVEPDHSAHLRVEMKRSPAADELARAVENARKRLGDKTITAPMRRIHELLGVDQAVFVKVAGPTYSAYVYDLADGKRTAHAELTLGDDDFPETRFVELAEALYAQVFEVVVETAPPPVREPQPAGQPFYKKWWFWTGVGVVATAVAVPLLLPDDSGDASPTVCPSAHVCGDIVFGFGF